MLPIPTFSGCRDSAADSRRLLSYVGGHNEGTYMVRPRQMETFRPSNVEHVDIRSHITHATADSYSLLLSSPISMSNFLLQIESATLERQIVDRLPPSYFASLGKEICDDVHDSIISLDHKDQQYIESRPPPLLQLAIRDAESYQLLLNERPFLEWQRYLINFVLRTQLAWLHRVFLIRGSREAKYKQCRPQCVRSTEPVVEIRNRAMSDHSTRPSPTC